MATVGVERTSMVAYLPGGGLVAAVPVHQFQHARAGLGRINAAQICGQLPAKRAVCSTILAADKSLSFRNSLSRETSLLNCAPLRMKTEDGEHFLYQPIS
jgi:hypothetical protein